MNTVPWHFIESVCLRLYHCTLRKVAVWFVVETTAFDSKEFVDYDKYYAEKEILKEEESVMFVNRDEGKLDLLLHLLLFNGEYWLQWNWGPNEQEVSSARDSETLSDNSDDW
uniref:Chromo domain-containing protein n=1 Tax=Steinernema glaseri TaxID=37863 RepID=A0A1I7ZVN9_9BILA